MSATATTVPSPTTTHRYYLTQSTFRKFTLAEYHRLIEIGVFTSGEPYELLEGNLIHKTPHGTPHDSAIQSLNKRLVRLLPSDWDVRCQSAVTLTGGREPEPDFVLVRGDESTYRTGTPAQTTSGSRSRFRIAHSPSTDTTKAASAPGPAFRFTGS